MAVYTSRLTEGGQPPLTSPTAGGAVVNKIHIRLGSSLFTDNDTVNLCKIPAGHELVDYQIYADTMGSTTGGASGVWGLVPTSWVSGTSTAGDMTVFHTFNSTSQATVQHLKCMDSIGLQATMIGLHTNGGDQDTTYALYFSTAAVTAASLNTSCDIHGYLTYKPAVSYEDVKNIRGGAI